MCHKLKCISQLESRCLQFLHTKHVTYRYSSWVKKVMKHHRGFIGLATLFSANNKIVKIPPSLQDPL